MSSKTKTKQIVAVVKRAEGADAKNFWTRIGVGFENRDDSWNLGFDYFPTNAGTTVQLHDFDARDDDGEPREHARGA